MGFVLTSYGSLLAAVAPVDTSQRLLGERWWDLECPQPPLESVPENDCLVLEEELPYDLPENFAVGV